MKTSLFTCMVLIVVSAFAFAGGKDKLTDINAALEKAKSENKLLFLEYGREACSNCQALRAMISKNEVRLPASKFVYADVNCDDSATIKAFHAKFKISGSTLPFVVIASPDGTQLAGRTGYGTAADFAKLIREAEKNAKSKS